MKKLGGTNDIMNALFIVILRLKKKMERIFHFGGIFFLPKMEIYRLKK